MKLVITGDALVATSTLTYDEWLSVSTNNPDALKIKDDEGNTKFALNYVEGKPNLNKFSITFGGITRDEVRNLTYTEIIPQGVEDAKAYVVDRLNGTIAYIESLEQSIPTEYDTIKSVREKLSSSIIVS